jgi:hypothetical protein
MHVGNPPWTAFVCGGRGAGCGEAGKAGRRPAAGSNPTLCAAPQGEGKRRVQAEGPQTPAQAAPVWMGAQGEEKKRVEADGPETAAQAAPGWMGLRSTKGTAHELDCERDLDCGANETWIVGPAVPTNQRPENSLRRPSGELLYRSCRLPPNTSCRNTKN